MTDSSAPHIVWNGLSLSRLMLGTAQLGMGTYGISNRTGQIDDRELLRYCERIGVNCYDTAYEYGDAELKLGAYFEGRPAPFIVSKLKVAQDLPSERELERSMVARTEQMLERLRLKKLPALMVHDPAMLERYGPAVGRILRAMRQDGLIERGGVSFGADPVEQYRRCAELVRGDIFEVVQLPFNVLDRRLVQCGALADFARAGKLVVARSVFLQGLLLMEPDALPPALQAEGAPLLERLRTFAAAQGMSVAQLALSYARDEPGIHCLVIGAEQPGQIRDNAELLRGPALFEGARAELDALFASVPNRLITPSLWRA